MIAKEARMIEIKDYQRKYRAEHKEKSKIWSREYYLKNKEKLRLFGKEWAEKNREKMNAYSKKYYVKNAEKHNAHGRENTQKLKKEVLTYYGNGEMKCVLCGFDNPFALTIDHINGNGAKHRKQIGGGGMKTYLWLKRNNYPEEYRTLCANCQLIEYLSNQFPALLGQKPPEETGETLTPANMQG